MPMDASVSSKGGDDQDAPGLLSNITSIASPSSSCTTPAPAPPAPPPPLISPAPFLSVSPTTASLTSPLHPDVAVQKAILKIKLPRLKGRPASPSPSSAVASHEPAQLPAPPPISNLGLSPTSPANAPSSSAAAVIPNMSAANATPSATPNGAAAAGNNASTICTSTIPIKPKGYSKEILKTYIRKPPLSSNLAVASATASPGPAGTQMEGRAHASMTSPGPFSMSPQQQHSASSSSAQLLHAPPTLLPKPLLLEDKTMSGFESISHPSGSRQYLNHGSSGSFSASSASVSSSSASVSASSSNAPSSMSLAPSPYYVGASADWPSYHSHSHHHLLPPHPPPPSTYYYAATAASPYLSLASYHHDSSSMMEHLHAPFSMPHPACVSLPCASASSSTLSSSSSSSSSSLSASAPILLTTSLLEAAAVNEESPYDPGHASHPIRYLGRYAYDPKKLMPLFSDGLYAHFLLYIEAKHISRDNLKVKANYLWGGHNGIYTDDSDIVAKDMLRGYCDLEVEVMVLPQQHSYMAASSSSLRKGHNFISARSYTVPHDGLSYKIVAVRAIQRGKALRKVKRRLKDLLKNEAALAWQCNSNDPEMLHSSRRKRLASSHSMPPLPSVEASSLPKDDMEYGISFIISAYGHPSIKYSLYTILTQYPRHPPSLHHPSFSPLSRFPEFPYMRAFEHYDLCLICPEHEH